MLISRFAISGLLTLSLNAQAQTHSMGKNVEPPFKRPSLEQPGFTQTDFQVSGLNPEDMSRLRTALTASHGFFTYHTERLLREVIKNNPDNPMPLIFAAYAQVIFGSGHLDRGTEYKVKADLVRSTNALMLDEHDEAWYDAISVLFEISGGDVGKREAAHIEKLADIIKKFPNDYEAKAFYALAVWDWKISVDRPYRDQDNADYFGVKNEEALIDEKKKNAEDKRKENAILIDKADRMIEEVLEKYPDHPIHHYKIHLHDEFAHHINAIDSAKRCGPANPSSAHLWHMPGHIFIGLNECYHASWHFGAAQRVDNRYLEQVRIQPQQIHNYAHNVDYLLMTRTNSAAVKDFDAIVRGSLAAPRLSLDASLHANALVRAMSMYEMYELWDTYLKLWNDGYVENIFDDVPGQNGFDSARFELVARAKRLRVIALYATYKFDEAETLFEDMQVNGILKGASLEPEFAKIQKEIMEDLSFRRDVYLKRRDNKDGSVSNLLNPFMIKHVTKLYTRKFAAAWIAIDDGNLDLAYDLVKNYDTEGFSETPPQANVHWTLTTAHVYHERGDFKKADALVKLACNLIDHTNVVDDLPIFARVSWALPALKKCLAAPTAHQNYDYMNKTDLRVMGDLALAWPNMPPRYRQIFPAQEAYDAELVVFSLGGTCPLCNKQLGKIVEKASAFKDKKILVRVIAADGAVMTLANGEQSQSEKNDPTLIDLFKDFGAYDEFTEKPIHGVYLIDKDQKLRYYHQSLHAQMDVDFLVKEFGRLMDIKTEGSRTEDFGPVAPAEPRR